MEAKKVRREETISGREQGNRQCGTETVQNKGGGVGGAQT